MGLPGYRHRDDRATAADLRRDEAVAAGATGFYYGEVVLYDDGHGGAYYTKPCPYRGKHAEPDSRGVERLWCGHHLPSKHPQQRHG